MCASVYECEREEGITCLCVHEGTKKERERERGRPEIMYRGEFV